MRRIILISASALTLALAACGGGGNQFGAEPDTGSNDVTDTGGDDLTGTGGDDVLETGGDATVTADGSDDDAEGSGSGGFDEAAIFYECDTDDDCNGETCVFHVCVLPPTEPAYVSDDEGDSPIEYEDQSPNTECYTTGGGLFEPAGEDREVRLTGIVERFGSGPPTTGLCLAIYDEQTLLPWQINSECNLLADQDEDDYIGCWQLDPCRCEEFVSRSTDVNDSMVTAAEAALELATGEPHTIDSLDTCFGFIGYCAAIEDTDLRADCVERVRTNGLAPEGVDTLILGHTRTTENEEDAALEDPEGISDYALDGVSTNWRFAFKVSGRANRWRDTWEYGLFTRGDLVRDDDSIRIDANALSAGAWATIPPAVGLAGGIDDTHGAVAGAIRDCGTDTRNPWAIVQATVGISFNQGSVLSYFNGNPDDRLPLPGRSDTNVLGTYAAIDLPPGPNRVAPIICLDDCSNRDNLVAAGGKNVFQTPQSVIIATFEGFFDL